MTMPSTSEIQVHSEEETAQSVPPMENTNGVERHQGEENTVGKAGF